MNFAVVSDFDGTITEFDVGDFLLLSFNLTTKEEIEKSYTFGMKVEEWMKVYFSRIKDVEISKIKDIIKKKVKIRDGFKEFVDFLNKKNIPFEIVSGGVDLYIEEVLKINLITAKGFWGEFNGGDIRYNFLENGMTLSEFKAKRVLYYKNLGYKTIFLGDSQNDYYAAKNADISFASLRLKEILENEEYPFRNLDNFYSVMETINASSTS